MSDNRISIKYVNDELGVSFGYSSQGPDKIMSARAIPVLTPQGRDHFLAKGGVIAERVNSDLLTFFNGPLTADLNIPHNYPYDSYGSENNVPIISGLLRRG